MQVLETEKTVLGPEHLDQHGQPSIYLPEPGTMDGGGKAVCASDGDKKDSTRPEHPDTWSSMHNLAATYRK